MKRFFYLALIALTAASCQRKAYVFSTFHEPATDGLRYAYSYDGLHWKEVPGTFLTPTIDSNVMRDPSILRGPDGIYHLVFTSAWKGSKSFGYASSKDLVHWSTPVAIPVMQQEPTTVNVWAPELFYDDEKKEYLIIWASTIPFRFPKGQEDENNNHRMYYTTTRDFVHFSETKLYFDQGFSVIDCQLVKRGPSDYVLVLKDNTRPMRNVRISFAPSPYGPFTPASGAVSPNFTEGPTTVKLKDGYVIYYDQYRDKIFGAQRTKDFQSFTDITQEVHLPKGHKHGTIIEVPRKDLKHLLHTTKP